MVTRLAPWPLSEEYSGAYGIPPLTREKSWELYGPIVMKETRMPAGCNREELALITGFLRGTRELYERNPERVRHL